MSWPEFHTDKISIINCDCMDYMATIQNEYFDLAIVDPPYGIDINMNMGRRAGKRKMYNTKPKLIEKANAVV